MMRFRLACIALPCWLFLCITYAQQDALAPIIAALQSRQFDRALELLRPALERAPQDPQLWAMRGTAYAGQGQNKEALTAFRKALKIAPDYLPALQGAIQIEFDAANPAAIPLLERVLRLRPGDTTSHAMLAVLEYQQGNCTAAVPHFERAASVLESQLSAQHAYAVCLVRLKQYDQAVRILQHSLELSSNDSHERRLLAAVQLMAGKPSDTIATLQPLLQADAPDAETLNLASSAYEDAGDTDHALSTLQKAIVVDPHNVNLYLNFAYLSAAHQSFQVGINAINDGIALEPKASPLYFARGVLYVQSGDYAKADADFEHAYALDPSQSLTGAARALAAQQANNLDGALGDVEEKLRRKPDDPLLLYVQADILAQKGAAPDSPQFQTAVASARKALTLRPNLAAAHGVLGKLYLQAAQYEQAAEECRKVLAIDPKDQAAVYRLIQALRHTNDKGEVPDLLKQLARLRRDAAKEESRRNRYKLVEGDAGP